MSSSTFTNNKNSTAFSTKATASSSSTSTSTHAINNRMRCNDEECRKLMGMATTITTTARSSAEITPTSNVVDEFLHKENIIYDYNNLMNEQQPQYQSSTMEEYLKQQQPQPNKLLFHTTTVSPTTILTPLPTKATTAKSITTTTTTNINKNNINNIIIMNTDGNNDVVAAGAVMLPHDTDPFSPTRKKSDPFHDGDIFSNLDPFEFEFARAISANVTPTLPSLTSANITTTTTTTTATTTSTSLSSSHSPSMGKTDVFSGPLQVSLPPEMAATVSPSMAAATNSSIRSRPVAAAGANLLSLQQQQQQQHTSNVVAASSALKQQTADVISSISNKKMPHLFGQTRFSKRTAGDTNTQINMRRLQESDSLSENETAPEPPPRPDSVVHIEPPPLPPKKQFNDIIIRPRATVATTSAATTSQLSSTSMGNRYEQTIANFDVPPIPLPSRRVGRTDGTYPGPGRPRKPLTATATVAEAASSATAILQQDNDQHADYLTPISLNQINHVTKSMSGGNVGMPDVPPPLLPPPMHQSTRNKRLLQQQQPLQQHQQQLQKLKSTDIYENKHEILQQLQQQKQQQQQQLAYGKKLMDNTGILPDITLSQLLTLGIDELAVKLNVPKSKLSTMTLVELTKYLAEFLEKSNHKSHNNKLIKTATTNNNDNNVKQQQRLQQPQPSIFRVNLDQTTTFMAKFDDTFGEDLTKSIENTTSSNDHNENGDTNVHFIANFAQFNESPVEHDLITTTTTKTKSGATTKRLPSVPPADRYAVFREIIDQDLQNQQQEPEITITTLLEPNDESAFNKTLIDQIETTTTSTNDMKNIGIQFNVDFDDISNQNADVDEFGILKSPAKLLTMPAPPPAAAASIINTKITEAVAQAKDRYAALRDIILVENLFDNVNTKTKAIETSNENEFAEFTNEFSNVEQSMVADFKPAHVKLTKRQQQQRKLRESSDVIALHDIELDEANDLDDDDDVDDDDVDDDDDDDDDEDDARVPYGEDEDREDVESSLDSNDKENGANKAATVNEAVQQQYEPLSTSTQQLNSEQKSPVTIFCHNEKFLTVGGGGGIALSLSGSKDDLEIDALMQRAISNLSLDSRERISPATSANRTTTPNQTTTASSLRVLEQPHYNDMSTSPITLPKTIVTQAPDIIAQASPVLTELSAVSSLIDSASKHLSSLVEGEKHVSGDTWATFDTPHVSVAEVKRGRKKTTTVAGGRGAALLSLPPAPPSNASQNDTAESPCSSDAREDNRTKGTCMPLAGTGANIGGHHRRWRGKEHAQHHTSSSSRDLSPWDDDPLPLADYQQPAKPKRQMTGLGVGGYYMCHNRRMNSCDEDYDYDEEYSNRRDHRKFKQGISHSRDNFDLDSPSWYYYPPHHTWSPQDVEQAAVAARVRSFDRAAYERSTYGPPIYDKRGVALPLGAPNIGYERRGVPAGYDKRSQKYYRDFSRPKYDFDEYIESPQKSDRYREGKGRRGNSDYENIYKEDGRLSYKTSRAEFMYERDRKSFDRDSIESFESASRRRRSFGSGDVYGSLESRDDFRERYGVEKTRSLRKSAKLRAIGDIDYEPEDSESEQQQFQQHQGRQGRMEPPARGPQRPNQLASVSSVSLATTQTRMRKSSGSSPWDGEETPSMPGQKMWKRPASATENERRLTENRRAAALTQTPSGSDDEKERRFRKKQRVRGSSKEMPITSTTTGSRYGNTPIAMHTARENYDYITYRDEEDNDEDYDVSPADEDKFERLNRCRRDMHQRMLETERRGPLVTKPMVGFKAGKPKKYAVGDFDDDDDDDDDDYAKELPASPTAQSTTMQPVAPAVASSSRLKSIQPAVGGLQELVFDGGFESDFNQSTPPSLATATAITPSSCTSTPAASATTPSSKSAFRFSNDFSEREKLHEIQKQQQQQQQQQFQQHPQVTTTSIISPTSSTNIDAILMGGGGVSGTGVSTSSMSGTGLITTPKLRFDERVRVTQIDDATAFEDDFTGAHFDFNDKKNAADEQWSLTTTITSVAPPPLSLPPPPPVNTIPTQFTNVGNILSTKKHNIRSTKLQQRNELIKKSESVNIFTKRVEDPFEDDEFFTSPIPATKPTSTSIVEERQNATATPMLSNSKQQQQQPNKSNKEHANNSSDSFQWIEADDNDDVDAVGANDNNNGSSNFAKFDENM